VLAVLCLIVSMLLTLPGCDSVPNGVHGGDLEGGLTVAERRKEFVTVATGPTSGIYYPIGGAFATALKAWGYSTSAQSTSASAENIQIILDGDAEIAIAMQDSVMQAYGGFGAYDGVYKKIYGDVNPAQNLRAMMRLWPNYVQLVTTANTGIKSVADLKGKRVGVGAANSGVELNARMIFEAYGMSYDDCTVDYLAYGEAIDNMKNGQCDAVFVTSGLPNATVTELATSYDMVIVPIDGAGRDALINSYLLTFVLFTHTFVLYRKRYKLDEEEYLRLGRELGKQV